MLSQFSNSENRSIAVQITSVHISVTASRTIGTTIGAFSTIKDEKSTAKFHYI